MIAHAIDIAGAVYILALAIAVYRIARRDCDRRRANRHAALSRLATDPTGAARGYPNNRGRGGAL